MESVNTLRMLLVAGAVLAGVGALAARQWVAGAVLLLAVVPHTWLSWYLRRQRGMRGRPENGSEMRISQD